MSKYKKKSLVDAELIDILNIENLQRLGASVVQINERSQDAFDNHAKVGQVVIWVGYDSYNFPAKKVVCAQCKTIEGLHTAELPSMLMKGENGDMYFCTKEIFDKTYEPFNP